MRSCPVGAVERSQRGDRAAAVGQLEHRAVAAGASADVVPKRLPLLSTIRLASGFDPLVPLNEASVVIVPLPWATSNTVPSSRGTSRRRCAEEIAAAVHDQAGRGCTVGAVERGQRGDRAAALGHLEHRAVAVGASYRRCAVQVAAAVHDQAGYGYAPLVPLNEASVVIVPLPWASSNTVPSPERLPVGCAVQVAAAVHDQRRLRVWHRWCR